MNNDPKYIIQKCYLPGFLPIGDLHIIQVGITHCSEQYFVGNHIHGNWFELSYALEGKGEIITNGVAVPICSGEIYLSFPGDIHAINSDSTDPLKYYYLSFYHNDPSVLGVLENIMQYYSEPKKRLFVSHEVKFLIENAFSEMMIDDKFSEKILEHSISELILYLFRIFNKDSFDVKINSHNELCYQIMHYINTHIYIIESLTCLADHFGYSYSYLSDVFKKTTGSKLYDYYTSRRFDTASMLLSEGRLNLGEIAQELKFSSLYTFSRAFKEYFGKSPSEFKRLNNISDNKRL